MIRVAIETPPAPPSEVVIRMSREDAVTLTKILWWSQSIPNLIAQGEERLKVRDVMTRLNNALRSMGIR